MIRTQAPAYTQAKRIDLVFPEKIECTNGAVIFLQREVKDESVKIDFEWDAGSKYQSKILQATFTNRMLLSGTNEKSAQQIAEEIDFYGGYTQFENDKDHAGFTIYGLSNQMNNIIPLVKEALLNAAFPEQQFDKEIEIAKSKFQIEIEKVKVLARRKFNQLVFGEGATYGQIAELKDFDALTAKDLSHFYKEVYCAVPHVFVTGNVSDEIIDLIKEWLSNYDKKSLKEVDAVSEQAKGVHQISKDGALQTSIRVGRRMFDKNHPDYFNFQLLNTILGGYFGSRLMANIREDKGYTYGIGSGLAVLKEASYFFISTEVAKEVKDDTIKEIRYELNKLQEELINEAELNKVKNYMLGEFLRQADGPIAQMEMFKNIYFNELKETYYQDFIDAIHNASVDDLKAVAQKYLNWEDMLIVLAG